MFLKKKEQTGFIFPRRLICTQLVKFQCVKMTSGMVYMVARRGGPVRQHDPAAGGGSLTNHLYPLSRSNVTEFFRHV